MILGIELQQTARCFDELNAAVEAMTDRVVCFNAHRYPAQIPKGAIVYNLENELVLTPDILDLWADHEVWEFSERTAKRHGFKYVPVGYHPSMERFRPVATKDIDVVFTGCLNDRRMAVLEGLAARDLKVAVLKRGAYGEQRDAVLARSKLAINMLFYEDGVFPHLRSAHLIANHVPVVSEICREDWPWAERVPLGELVERAHQLVACSERERELLAAAHYEKFTHMPMVLPS